MPPLSVSLFFLACFLWCASASLALILPLIDPYYRAYGAKADPKQGLIVLAFAVAAKLIGL